MEKGKKAAVPQGLFLTSILSASLTAVMSITYLVLSILGTIFRFNCQITSSSSTRGADHFMNMIHRVYIMVDVCNDALNWENLTSSDSVFILNVITACVSVLTFITAVGLITIVLSEENIQYINVFAYMYVGVYVASLVVDLTFATHFGMDYSHLSEQMNWSSPGLPLNYDRDMVRLGALLFMAIALKGFVAHVVNLVLIVLLLVYVADFQQSSKKEEHSIHKFGALNAYDRTRRQDSWQQEPPMFLGQQRGPHTNPAFVDDSLPPPRTPGRERSYNHQPTSVISDYSSRGINRSDSWQPSAISGSRPFSYLEENKRPAVAPRPASPAEPQWRRDWQPPVPAPDYSPQAPRRLKSALKPSYM